MYSGREMKFSLNQVTARIECPDDRKLVSNKTFCELLCMSSSDMVYGYRTRMKVINQAQRNHARFIASIILMVLLSKEKDFISTKALMVSWEEQKNRQLWKRLGIKRGKDSVERLDWFLYNIMINGESIQEWLNSPAKWELMETEDDGNKSDTSYDDSERVVSVEYSEGSNMEGDKETNEGNRNIFKTLWRNIFCR